MGLMDVLQQYTSPSANPDSDKDFGQMARQLPTDAVGSGLAHAFRSDQTPPFSQMVSQMFGNSDPQQRAGLLNHLMRSVGPGVLAKVGGGALSGFGHMPSPGAAPGQPPTVSPVDAQAVTPDQVREIAEEAQKHDPGIMDQVGRFYADHPDLIKGLGAAAMALVLGQAANRMKR